MNYSLYLFVGQTEADVVGYIVILYRNIRTIINPPGITLNHYRGPSLLLVSQQRIIQNYNSDFTL